MVSEIEYDKWVDEYEAEIAKLKELQPCGHPIQAIRSTPYIGDQHSNYCGWCADVEHERELCQALTAELLEYRGQVARLREELKKMMPWAAMTILPERIEATLVVDWQSANAALSDTADDWLEQHDAEVRAQERERCAGLVDEKELERRNAATRAEAMKEERCIVLTLEVEADEFAELATAIREADDDV